MKDEIKEILDNIKEDINGKFEWEYIDGYYVQQIKPLLNYITNLQQEIEKLNDDKRGMLVQLYKANDNRDKVKQENYELNRMCELYGKSLYYAELTDYKSRCEKANNQLKIIMQILKEQPNRSIKDDEWLENRLIGVVNILQNGSEEK